MPVDQLAAHAQSFPTAWNPALTEVSAAWAAVLRAVSDSRQLTTTDAQSTSFAVRYTREPELVHALSLVSNRGLHPLLLAWATEAASARLSAFAVPSFWARYAQLVQAQERRSTVSTQRKCVSGLLGAVGELHAAALEELQLLHFLERQAWRASTAGIYFFVLCLPHCACFCASHIVSLSSVGIPSSTCY